jgi:type IV secretory pathway VirD2 relaxase
LIGRDHHISRRILSKNNRTTAAQVTAELTIHFEDAVSTKTVRRELHKSNIHGGAAIWQTSDY